MMRKASGYTEEVNTQNYKTSYHLKGRVIDSIKNAPLAFTSISINNSTIGTYTDEAGNFDIEIPAEYAGSNITIQYLGYENQEYKIAEAEDSFLLIPLKVSPYNISEIMIVNREADIKIGGMDQALTINNTQVQNSTSGLAGNDLARNLQLLPGINATDDASADIKIRGSNSDETLLILDGIPVYNASHYYGVFSAINSNYLETINLYKNAFPIEYGGKTAGVVEMLSKDEISDKSTLLADLNLLTASVNLGLPITPTSNLFVSGRSTIGDVSNTKFNSFSSNLDGIEMIQNFRDNVAINKADPNFNFYDINAKYLWVPNDQTKLSLNFYNSSDAFSVDSGFSASRTSRELLGFKIEQEENWNNLGASVLLNTTLGKNLALEGRLFYSIYSNDGNIEYNIKNDNARVKNQRINASQLNNVSDLGINIKVSKNQGENNISIGIDAIQHDVEYRFQENKKINIKGKNQVAEVTPYVAFDFAISDKLKFNLGGRSTYYQGTDKLYFSPRSSFNYTASDKINFKGSFSLNQQFLRELNYEYRGQLYELWVQADQANIPIIDSRNLMLGGTLRFGNFLLDVEAFDKDMSGMIEYAVVNPTGQKGDDAPGQPNQGLNENSQYNLFIGEGRSKGIDVLLNANFKKYDTYLSYTLSKTEHSFDQISKGEYFASEDDRTHQLKWINEYHLGGLTLGANWIFSSGRLYTNLSAFINNEDIRDIQQNRRFKRLPSYQRLDLSISYRIRFADHSASLGLSMFNALDYQNVKYEQLIESRNEDDKNPLNRVVGTTTSLLNRTLNLSLKIDLK